jgi:hypothetical protein
MQAELTATIAGLIPAAVPTLVTMAAGTTAWGLPVMTGAEEAGMGQPPQHLQ